MLFSSKLLHKTISSKFFNIEFDNAISNKESSVEIRQSQGVMPGFDILVQNESHTLGHILQSYINTLNDDIFIAYMNPHPLKKTIMFRINVEDINILKQIIITTSSTLITNIDKLRNDILSKFEAKKIFRKKKSPKTVQSTISK